MNAKILTAKNKLELDNKISKFIRENPKGVEISNQKCAFGGRIGIIEYC